ncbi:MAG: hypothetical protein MJ025_05330 [Victivallaceae bacterium]|nr:hypothetical protein [Victivallaceae bacterium]
MNKLHCAIASAALAAMPAVSFDSNDVAFLEEMTREIVKKSTVVPNEKVSNWQNRLGIPFVKPGADKCYPSFWIRDYAMSLECGIIPKDHAKLVFHCVADHQAQSDIKLASGAVVPAGSIPDHIRPDGEPIYFPGTYDPVKSGGPVWGFRPALDDNFFFIEIASYAEIDMKRHGKSLEDAFDSVHCDENGVVECDESNRGVSFGFSDSVFQTGKLLWATLLKAHAAELLSEMFMESGDAGRAAKYRTIANTLKSRIPGIFMTEDGLLASSTGTSNQPDVWGSAYAVYKGLVDKETANRISTALARLYADGQISCLGQICHVPRNRFHSEKSCWEKSCCGIPVNVYQNGSYWGTPTGWVAYAIGVTDRKQAEKLLDEYMAHLRDKDFRNADGNGAPWECIYPANGYFQNPAYLTSVSCPLAAAKRHLAETSR